MFYIRHLSVVILSFFLISCQTQVHYQGKSIQPEQQNLLKVGQHTKQDVLNLIGTPTTTSDYGQDKWLYVSRITETKGFLAPHVVEQKVVTLTFGKNDVLASITEKELCDAEDVDLVERLTPASGQRDSALKQIFSNFGRFAKKER